MITIHNFAQTVKNPTNFYSEEYITQNIKLFKNNTLRFVIDINKKLFCVFSNIAHIDSYSYVYGDTKSFLNDWIFTVLTIDGMFEQLREFELFTTNDLEQWAGRKTFNFNRLKPG